MDRMKHIAAPASLRHHVQRVRHASRQARQRAMQRLLRELDLYLELDAIVEYAHRDPMAPSAGAVPAR